MSETSEPTLTDVLVVLLLGYILYLIGTDLLPLMMETSLWPDLVSAFSSGVIFVGIAALVYFALRMWA